MLTLAWCCEKHSSLPIAEGYFVHRLVCFWRCGVRNVVVAEVLFQNLMIMLFPELSSSLQFSSSRVPDPFGA